MWRTVLPQKSENVRRHYSHPSRENATPSSGTSTLASYKEVTPRVSVALKEQRKTKTNQLLQPRSSSALYSIEIAHLIPWCFSFVVHVQPTR